MKTSSEYYLQAYGVAPLVQPQYQGPVYDPSTLDYESSVGGEFDFGSDSPVYAEIPPSQQDFAALQGGNSGAAASADPGLVDELDGMIGEAGPQADSLSLLQEVKEELKKPETKNVLSEEQLDDFEDRISDLSAAARKSGANLDEIASSVEELKENLNEAVEEATMTRQERVASSKATIDGIMEKVEKSKLASTIKDDLKSRLEDLKEDLGKDGVDLAEVREKMTEINKEVSREIQIEDLSRKLETLPSKIPSEGWHKEQTMELATKLTDALRNGDWGSVRTYLIDKRDHHKNEGNNFIPQLIGTIFMDLAGSDEDKLDQFLALIPAEIRDLMAEAATQEDVNSTEHLDNPLKYKYYGRPSATADRLRSSRIDEALDQIEVESLPVSA